MIVHRFRMGDVEDAQLYAAGPIIEWQKSEAGTWVMEHALETPIFKTGINSPDGYIGYVVVIEAQFTPEDEIYFWMRYGDQLISHHRDWDTR